MTHPFDALTLDDLRARRSEKWRAYPPDVLPAWVAEMDYPLADPIERVLHELAGGSDTGYAHAHGPDLPEAYAAFAAERYGQDVDPSGIYLLQDVMRGVLVSVLLLTSPGDGVVINPPVYPPFYRTIGYSGRRVVEAPLARHPDTGRYELDLDALDRAFREGARAYLLCNPHNPTGRTLGLAELEGAASLAERYGVVVLSDEVHGPLTYPGERHIPFASLDAQVARDSLTFVSASKAWNVPGLKCAMIVTPSAARADVLRALPDEVAFGTGIMGLAANEAAYREGRPWLDDTLRYLDANRRLAADLIAERLPGIRWVPPEATYLAWLDCSALGLGDDPATAFLDRGRVALSPGASFGTGGDGFARLNLATSRAILTEAIERMARAC